ncbi:hypothetical protein [Sporomusa malonica]|uniref:Uncharacterized protein n=1 Tax=Sporomusa malonica TaxID=112901 RepID=A0A1W2A4C8_9FIRM|nr:hypothetical protein [Sporomusa malonica]SMC55496.1 hypothetical protein SAMN04488500_1054 [Sporomusa malonica]
MTILKPDFSQIIHAIQQIRQGEQVEWDAIINNNLDEVQEGYQEITDKIAEVNDRVIKALEYDEQQRNRQLAIIIGELKQMVVLFPHLR